VGLCPGFYVRGFCCRGFGLGKLMSDLLPGGLCLWTDSLLRKGASAQVVWRGRLRSRAVVRET